jgi:hypothetical protein
MLDAFLIENIEAERLVLSVFGRPLLALDVELARSTSRPAMSSALCCENVEVFLLNKGILVHSQSGRGQPDYAKERK